MLRVPSVFSAGSSEPESFIERAVELDMPAMALADQKWPLWCLHAFIPQQSINQVKAHIGAEIAVSSFGNRLVPAEWLPHQCPDEPPRIVLLCASQVGYQNLCQLITRFKMREATKAEGAATFDDLEEFSAGLICLTGGEEGPLAAALNGGGEACARTTLDRLTSIYGHSNVYVELQRHLEREEEYRNIALLNIASTLDLPIIATNGVRCATQVIVNFSTYLLRFAITRLFTMPDRLLMQKFLVPSALDARDVTIFFAIFPRRLPILAL